MATLKGRAKEAFLAKKWQKALETYTECINIHPEAVLYSNRSACFVERGLFAEALADADLALERDGKFAKAHFRRGKALEGLHRLGDAAAAYRCGDAADPSNPAFASAAKRVEHLRVWLRDRGGPAPEAPDPDALKPNLAPPQTALERDLTNKGACSYYYADAATAAAKAAAPVAIGPSATSRPRRAAEGNALVAVASYYWDDRLASEARIYLPFPAERLRGLDAKAAVEVRVDAVSWRETKLDVYVHFDDETAHLAIPRLYDKVSYADVIKKKAKLIVCLRKLAPAAWPQLEWDARRDNEHVAPRPAGGSYSL